MAKEPSKLGVGDFVTVGGALTGASGKVTAIDESNADFDDDYAGSTQIGAAKKGLVLVQPKTRRGESRQVGLLRARRTGRQPNE